MAGHADGNTNHSGLFCISWMKKILLIQTASIGDVILATPILEKLHEFYPEAVLDIFVKKGNEVLFESHPFLRKVYVWDKRSQKYKNWRILLGSVRKERYDLVVNVQRFLMTGLLTVFSKAGQTVGFSKNPLSVFFSKRFPHHIACRKGDPVVHEVDRNLSLIRHLTDSISVRPQLYPTPEQYAKVSQFKSKKYICIAPTSLWATKQFPKEKWIELIQKLGPEISIYYLGAPVDAAVCDQIMEHTRTSNAWNLAGKLSLLESAALMRDSVMNFVNDSSPMHLASAVNAKTTAIFCSTIPEFGFGPLSDDHQVIEITEDLSCRPCGLHGYKQCPEKHFKCAYQIDVDRMLL